MALIDKLKSWLSKKNPTLTTHEEVSSQYETNQNLKSQYYTVSYEIFIASMNHPDIRNNVAYLNYYENILRQLDFIDMCGLTPIVLCDITTRKMFPTSWEHLNHKLN